MHSLPTNALQSFEEDFLAHSFYLDEDVVQHYLGLVSLEIVLLCSAFIGA